ncbi:MAG: hypothetical protein N3C62_00530 [Synergistetes bacterium]|nr:hypothetical protein [Synergistota bacterium]MCX8127223.1 hypothetical protein [Synergistota bacterium]MDW8191891.1 cobamide remodeling phosphodiesterase CbiR [Synergistota bacterium]
MKLPKKQVIGTTSWLVPGTYYENALIASPFVDFIELLVYTWDEDTKALLISEIEKLNSLTEKNNLLYTVHLPTDNIINVEMAYDFFLKSNLKIINYVLHPMEGIEKFLLKNGKNVSLENLKEEIVYHENLTFDIGHHMLGKKFPKSYIKNIREVHLMGVIGEEDHLKLNEATLNELINFLGERLTSIPIICFEVFNIDDAVESILLFSRYTNKEG